ncbi:magnesium transporter NIPA-domain-containing protein [Baffinella frigidus]|nr:magnesium transporter NIPA-domain-containing protein [Cryptophyta sp. CCMP2293]
MLRVTCHEDCLMEVTNSTCLEHFGCVWDQDASHCQIDKNNTVDGQGWIGVLLSLLGDIIINIGMNSMKYAHNGNQHEITGDPIRHYLRLPLWWVGILLLVAGELGNLVAYGYAPAAIVTPIGSIGVVTNVFITTYILKEPFRWSTFAGAFCVVVGIIVVVTFAPMTVIEITSENVWSDVAYTMEGGIYLAVLVVSFITVSVIAEVRDKVGKKWGEKTVLIYIGQCAILSTMTIVCAKTFSSILSSAMRNGFSPNP